MPSTSIAQQRLMGQAYALKTGELKSSDLDPKYRKQIEDLAASMSEKDLKDFAETSHKGLPQKVKENYTMNKHIPTFESFVNESIDVKYWEDYNTDTSGQGKKEHEVKSKDFEDTFEDAVVYWNQEADGAENRIKGAQIQKIKKLAQEFFKKAGWISSNVIQAMIAQES
jgi:hypothetical protein